MADRIRFRASDLKKVNVSLKETPDGHILHCDVCGREWTADSVRKNGRLSPGWYHCDHPAQKPRKTKEENPLVKKCLYCGFEFVTINSRKKYCSQECAREADKIIQKEWYQNRKRAQAEANSYIDRALEA